ncbi:MAG TPA: winged helix-turn-helix domain-containing protein [Cyclobacteriaceae bacterium]|nr:winged helix-turn-helix domain-containing protein [Cyclobacteriaceae bacterium]
MKILLIEDELKTLTYIRKGLEENSHNVDTASDGIAGRYLAMNNKYDLIISDVVLPGLDGRALCRELRAAKIDTPLLMLTALGGADHVVEGLDSGADDYLAKPFEFKELMARIRSLSKRGMRQGGESNLTIGDLEMDLEAKSVKRGSKSIALTVKEFALLEYLLRHKGRVLSRKEIARNVWNLDFDTGTNTVEVYVNYLRKKVDRDFDKKLIHTQFGMGYVMKEE